MIGATSLNHAEATAGTQAEPGDLIRRDTAVLCDDKLGALGARRCAHDSNLEPAVAGGGGTLLPPGAVVTGGE